MIPPVYTIPISSILVMILVWMVVVIVDFNVKENSSKSTDPESYAQSTQTFNIKSNLQQAISTLFQGYCSLSILLILNIYMEGNQTAINVLSLLTMGFNVLAAVFQLAGFVLIYKISYALFILSLFSIIATSLLSPIPVTVVVLDGNS
ncbi:hypothetical protein CONCODRAFT_12345 [Conidiobolus coronatus NRRL 28638]|uniref:Uncharacterized protein n=1 Tax=Conidiobolus coronatus (strain ATCC 28846 / CBS 209.66 / NRRL 28638) TaxID=796925 RepID=A0A137NT17_CONC2|nr:hypothetical protein CONCODRAFT_12345 [Conidiobolus coronatus NRRL 28638]|eukprot:KXN65937.1 hypothetical protein CONCODRAFT_12345 [Conidiobolus coronatus NRRL 28638]